MPTPDPHKLVARLIAEAKDDALDDAAFRRRTLRTARQLQRALEAPRAALPAKAAAATPTRKTAPARPASPYRYIAVPNGAGRTTSVSVSNATFESLAHALGGAAQVSALARKVAAGHQPESGVSRSAYVVRRLQQRAARPAK